MENIKKITKNQLYDWYFYSNDSRLQSIFSDYLVKEFIGFLKENNITVDLTKIEDCLIEKARKEHKQGYNEVVYVVDMINSSDLLIDAFLTLYKNYSDIFDID